MLNRTRAPGRRTIPVALALLAAAAACDGGNAPVATVTADGDGAAPAAAVEPAQAGPDDFHVPPDPLPAGEPGDIIRSRPSSAGPPTARSLADAWQVMYLSTDALGQPMAVTGTVLVPKGADPATAPIVGLGPGTHGPAFRCAPSLMIDQAIFYEQAAVNDMLQRGYAVAVTDYEGYHPGPATTYMVGRSMGPALIDAVRAAQRLPEGGLSADVPVALRGYSQGGGAALWAGELQPDYAPELDLVGVAAGGVPADLAQVGLPLNGGDGFGVFLYALYGQDNAYPELSMAPHLNEAGRQAVARMEGEMCILDLLDDFAGDRIEDYTATSPIDSDRLNRIMENNLGGQAIQVPVLQYHESQDGLVAFGQAQTLRDDYCELGVDHTWQTYDTGGETGIIRHINLVYGGNADVNQFLEARFAGEPAASTC